MIDPNSTHTESIEALYFAYRAFTAEPDRVLAARGLGRAHHRIVHFVGRQPGITVGGLLDTLSISKQALAGPLRRLVQDGLVHSEPDADDKRIRKLSLTPTGAALAADLSAVQSAMLQRAFALVGHDAAAAWLDTTLALAAQDTGAATP
ncbi:MAG: MarR family transcriptional regulator [Pseudomonadota bacterium]